MGVSMNSLDCLRSLNPLGAEETSCSTFKPMLSAILVCAAIFLCAIFHWTAISAPVLIPLFWRYRRLTQERHRVKSFSNDLPALLVALASIIRAGGDAITAMLECRELFEEGGEMRRQLEAFRDSVKAGMTESEALRNFAHDIPLNEISLLRRALLLARSEGSSLGPALVRLARVTRQRQSFERKVRSALAMQRLSSMGLIACAGAILLFQYITNPQSVERALMNQGGLFCMSVGCLLVVVGTSWMIVLASSRIGEEKC